MLKNENRSRWDAATWFGTSADMQVDFLCEYIESRLSVKITESNRADIMRRVFFLDRGSLIQLEFVRNMVLVSTLNNRTEADVYELDCILRDCNDQEDTDLYCERIEREDGNTDIQDILLSGYKVIYKYYHTEL